MSKVTVYSKDDCSNCQTVKNFLKNNEVEFVEVNVSHDEEGLKHVKELGFQALPVTEIEGHAPFSGFDLGKLSQVF